MEVSEEDVLAFLRQIETGEVILTPTLNPQVHIKGEILYEADNGWKIEISNWSGQFSGIVEIVLPNGRILDMDFLDENMPDVCFYSPDKDVEWRAYRMKKTIWGYIYKPEGKLGIFEGAKAGQIISNPDREPPWIIVNHSLRDTIVAKWPGQLWLAEVLDALEPQNHRGNYTRCVSVKMIKPVETDWLFGSHGKKIEEVLNFANKLDIDAAQRLVLNRSKEAGPLTSEGWHRWKAKVDIVDDTPEHDMEGVIMLGSGSTSSPIGHGLGLVHDGVWQSAKREMGNKAFEEDEEEMWIKPPWSGAASALMDAAWALGVPDLFSEPEMSTLLQAWNRRLK